MNVTWAPEVTLGLCKERAERRQCPEIRLAQRTSGAGGLQGKQYVEDVEDEVHGLCNGLHHPLLTDRVWGHGPSSIKHSRGGSMPQPLQPCL